jgi:hypothetical protein
MPTFANLVPLAKERQLSSEPKTEENVEPGKELQIRLDLPPASQYRYHNERLQRQQPAQQRR